MPRERPAPCPVSGLDCRKAWRADRFKNGVWKTQGVTVRIEPNRTDTILIFYVAGEVGNWTLYVEDPSLGPEPKRKKGK